MSALRPGETKDVSKVGVPSVLAVGLIALFALPTIEDGAMLGESHRVNFRDARMLLEMLGGAWLLWLAWIGIGVAIVGALFLKPV